MANDSDGMGKAWWARWTQATNQHFFISTNDHPVYSSNPVTCECNAKLLNIILCDWVSACPPHYLLQWYFTFVMHTHTHTGACIGLTHDTEPFFSSTLSVCCSFAQFSNCCPIVSAWESKLYHGRPTALAVCMLFFCFRHVRKGYTNRKSIKSVWMCVFLCIC